jgi:hypothetical protein
MTTICKNRIRSFAYATALAITTLNFAPSLASGQETARGTFTLSHDVRWANVSVPAGEYHFSYGSEPVARVVRLNELTPGHRSFLVLVESSENVESAEATSADPSQLLVMTAADGTRYVSAMRLPEFGMALKFPTPSRTLRQIARAESAAAAGR